jgi:hypothetical protein
MPTGLILGQVGEQGVTRVSSHSRAEGLSAFPTIRIIDRSLFHLPVRRSRPETARARVERDRRNTAAADLFLGAVIAARSAATGF